MNNSDEPNLEPQPDQWYNLTLGSSFNEQNPSKFCTLRYEFKPASIDKNQRGTMHKSKDNKVTVEFQNIQHGKPKVTFEGTSEDYKDTDAVLFFDGESFRLERLHRAVKRLRHNRTLGESAASSVKVADASPPLVGRGTKHQALNRDVIHAVPVEVERIEIGNIKGSDSKSRHEKPNEFHAASANSSKPSPGPKIDDQDQHLDMYNPHEDGTKFNIDINEQPHQADMEDENAEIDVSDVFEENGPNAAEALRAQNAQEKASGTSSSSGSSGSESSSGSGSASSSSDSDSSDAESLKSI